MKITLTREIQLKKTEAVISINRETLRQDIQDYLKGKGYDDKLLDNGIKNYLKSVGIYDENFNLTPYGRAVQETGIFKVKEKGKYQIWIDGKKILLIKRIAPMDDTRDTIINRIPLDKEGHFCLPFDNEKEFYRFEIRYEQISGTELKAAESINEKIELTDDNKSNTSFSGKMINDTTINENTEFGNISLYDMSKKIFGELWNANTNRLKIQFNSLNDTDKEYFETNYSNTWDLYKIQIERLPIEPYDIDEAHAWRDKLLNDEITKQYLHPNDFFQCVSEINGKKGFSSYKPQLNIPKINQCIEKLDTAKKSDRSSAFWHLAAPLDLNVDIPKHLKITTFNLMPDEKYSFENIVMKFGSITADKIFYYDRHVANYYQQRSVVTFLKCFDIPNIYIITNTKPSKSKFSDYFSKRQEFTVNDIQTIYQNEKGAHGRYLVFKKDDKLTIWKIDNSIDYIRFDTKGDIPPNTEGRIVSDVTFTQVKQEGLDKKLAKFIQEN